MWISISKYEKETQQYVWNLRREYPTVTIVDTKGRISLSVRKGERKMRGVVGARGRSYLQRLWRTRTTTSTGTRSISTGDEHGGDEVLQSSKVKIFDRNLKRRQVKLSPLLYCTPQNLQFVTFLHFSVWVSGKVRKK